MSLKLAQKGGTQITAPLQNSAVFTQSEYASPERNVFNLSKQTHGSLRFGMLYPVYSRMLMPGDNFKVQPSHFIRFASVLSPILNKISISYSAFFVPFRVIWKFFPTFISGGYSNDGVYTDQSGNYLDANDKPTTSPFKPEIPFIDVTLTENDGECVYDIVHGSLADWLGFPTFETETDAKNAMMESISSLSQRKFYHYNALPFMAYQKVINDWFVNPNIKDIYRLRSLPPSNVTGALESFTGPMYTETSYDPISNLAFINYGLDYFTSCLPYLQRGDAYTLSSSSDVITNVPKDEQLLKANISSSSHSFNALGVHPADSVDADNPDYDLKLLVQSTPGGTSYSPAFIDFANSVQIKWNTTIQELRYVNALQKFAEKSLRVGTRYIDFLKCYFDVTSSNKALQRSEFLGSAVFEVNKTTVTQTTPSNYAQSALEKTTPLGTQATNLQSMESAQSFNCFAEEHGMFFVMACVMPETIYNNRMPREYLYETKEDFLFPEFTHLSPQGVYAGELFAPSTEFDSTFDPFKIFGYQDRYNELRTAQNDVHGDFKGNLSFFLQQRTFATQPTLNAEFLKANDIDTSIFAADYVIDDKGASHKVEQIWASFNFDVKATRLLPKLATPSLI